MRFLNNWDIPTCLVGNFGASMPEYTLLWLSIGVTEPKITRETHHLKISDFTSFLPVDWSCWLDKGTSQQFVTIMLDSEQVLKSWPIPMISGKMPDL